jgi:hypothetical protein
LLLSHTTDFTDDENGQCANAQRQSLAGLALAEVTLPVLSGCAKFAHPERGGIDYAVPEWTNTILPFCPGHQTR